MMVAVVLYKECQTGREAKEIPMSLCAAATRFITCQRVHMPLTEGTYVSAHKCHPCNLKIHPSAALAVG